MRSFARARFLALTGPRMALLSRPPGFSSNTEVEASSFSVWNCVITFLQILLVSTVLYGASWNGGQLYDLTPAENLNHNNHFRAIAFFFSVWALQSVALAFLLVWGIGKRSYHLCHSWLLCEILMQMFIILSAVYFAYRSYLEKNLNYVADSNEEFLLGSTTTITTANLSNHSPGHHHHTFRVPRHFVALLILHFLIKGFGFWIVRRYMVLLKTSGVRGRNGSNETDENGNSECRTIQQNLPPPSYEQLSKDEPPCYDEALKLCLKDSTMDNSGCTQNHSSESNRSSNTQVDSKDNLPPV